MSAADTLATYRRWLAIDSARARHLAAMFRVADGRPFAGYEQRLDEYRTACRRARRWQARIDELRAGALA